jgi:zinc-ribbon domain
MNCPRCQAANGPGAAFCSKCGQQLADGPAPLPTAGADRGRLSPADKTAAGATLVTLIALWLPWFSAGGFTDDGFTGHGWLWLEFLLALGVIAYLAARAAWGQLPFRLPVSHQALLSAATGLQFLLVLAAFAAAPAYYDQRDFGAFFALVASVVAAVPAVSALIKSHLGGSGAAS